MARSQSQCSSKNTARNARRPYARIWCTGRRAQDAPSFWIPLIVLSSPQILCRSKRIEERPQVVAVESSACRSSRFACNQPHLLLSDAQPFRRHAGNSNISSSSGMENASLEGNLLPCNSNNNTNCHASVLSPRPAWGHAGYSKGKHRHRHDADLLRLPFAPAQERLRLSCLTKPIPPSFAFLWPEHLRSLPLPLSCLPLSKVAAAEEHPRAFLSAGPSPYGRRPWRHLAYRRPGSNHLGL